MKKIYENQEDILKVAESSINVCFSDLDKTGRLGSLKGGIGQMIEEGLFGLEANSDSAPDFKELGIELKVTAFVKRKNKIRAKERLVLNIINYMEENFDSFYDSHFWYKNKRILMMFYEYNHELVKDFWFIDNFILFDWPENDLAIIINDWKIISEKIKSGNAHMISESDTMYLAACTKGATAATSLRNQPFSKVKAKQRAYSLKNSYMTYLLNHYVYGNKSSEKIIKSKEELQTSTFENIVLSRFRPYFGKTQQELVDIFQIKKSKSTNASIVNKILKLNSDISETEEFMKANIQCKTIRIERNGKIKEHMSFPTFKFKDIINQTWEESDFHSMLSQTKYMFVIFNKQNGNDESAVLENVIFWGMPDNDIEIAGECWKETVRIIKEGVIFTPVEKGIQNNLPKAKDNQVSHVRPHASKAYYNFGEIEIGDSKDGDELPDGRWMTKQCFWINNTYIQKNIIKK